MVVNASRFDPPRRLAKYCLRLPASTMIQPTTALNTVMHEVTCRETHELLNMSEENSRD